jgi:hypothetical protein
MDPGGFIGWQMDVPTKGLVRLSLFGTEPLCRSDLEWVLEKTGKPAKGSPSKHRSDAPDQLYELFLPIAEDGSRESAIGFGAKQASSEHGLTQWPTYFTGQFEELVKVLRTSGAALRCVLGPVTEAERERCRKSTLRTYGDGRIPFAEYLGCPVRIRVLLRLPAQPSVRLKTVLEEAVPGAKLRFVGRMEQETTASAWESPLASAPIVPDLAARILTLEPETGHAMVGIETCEEAMKKIPASHKNTKDKNAVLIGKAVDTTGTRRSITIGNVDLKRHYQIVGQTGTGKSTLLATLILNAIESGHGLTFFDPHGSTIDVVLRSLPEKYADKVRVIRLGDTDNPVPLNLWDSDDPAKEERNISDLCDLFGDLFDPRKEGFLGPRWERWFSTFAKASIAFLGRMASLESIAVISQSQDNMLKVSKAIVGKYPELVETIKQEYGLDKSGDFHNTLNWYLCKFQRLTSVEQLRNTLGAGANALDFARTIDTDAVTLIDLGTPVMGTHAARVIGTLLLMKLWNAVLARQQRDRTHLVVVDEAALFQTNPMPRMLAESRKFGISMVLCHQHTGQLTEAIRTALEANSANFSAFRLSPSDARVAAVRFDNPEMSVSLTRLNAFNAITSLSVDGRQTAPFTLETIRPKHLKKGEEIAARVETQSIASLVEPYRRLRALTTAEILELLNHPEKRAEQKPEWLREWIRQRNELKSTG